MATKKIIIGRVGYPYKGKWDSTKTYNKRHVVSNGYSTFFSLVDGNVGNALPTTDDEEAASKYWRYFTNAQPAKEAAEAANKAAELANTATSNANKATSRANTAADTVESQQAQLTTLKTTLNEAKEAANEAAQNAEAKVEEIDTLSLSLVQQVYPRPTVLKVEAPTEISTHNSVTQYIKATLLPSYVGQNVIYQCDEGSSLKVDPSGKLTVKGKGETTFYVIPTENTSLWQTVTINVRTPRLRLSNGKIRLSAAGKARIA